MPRIIKPLMTVSWVKKSLKKIGRFPKWGKDEYLKESMLRIRKI